MGAFFKAFWGQMGRNTAKRVSNSLFGDKWSTPYRVGVSGSRKQSRKSTRDNSGHTRRHTAPAKSEQRPATNRTGWWYFLGGFILFSGTYSVIVSPNKNDIVLVVMLWCVAILFFLYKVFWTSR